MKHFIFAATAASALLLGAAGASAQGLYIGPEGFGLGVTPQYEGHAYGARHMVIREYQDEDGCTVRVIRDRWPSGNVETRRVRDCG